MTSQASASLVKAVDSTKVQSTVQEYLDMHNDSKDGESKRKTDYTTLVNHYYDLATDFYEYGWGDCFHFAVRFQGENFYASLSRHEHWLAKELKLEKNMKVLDVGCGVGGPARQIARFAECYVTGLNNNQYQVERANKRTAAARLEQRCNFVKADFMHLPFEDNTFDAIYQIEATAHAPDKVACYKEIMRVLKPGGYFGGYEWCLTDKYDAEDPEHRAVKKGIEEGDGLPDIATTKQVVEALYAAGYEVVREEDRALSGGPGDIEWYDPLVPRYSLSQNVQHTWIGRTVMSTFLRALERTGLAAEGTVQVQEFLVTAAHALVRGGQWGIFTPMFFTLARKPVQSESEE